MMTPWGMYMNPRRTGGLAAFFFSGSAQPMVSNRGSARATPIPFRYVRRSMTNLLLMGRGRFELSDTTLSERVARDDLGDQGLHMIAIFGDGFHQAIHHNFVIALELTTERIGQQFLRQVPGELGLLGGDDDLE